MVELIIFMVCSNSLMRCAFSSQPRQLDEADGLLVFEAFSPFFLSSSILSFIFLFLSYVRSVFTFTSSLFFLISSTAPPTNLVTYSTKSIKTGSANRPYERIV